MVPYAVPSVLYSCSRSIYSVGIPRVVRLLVGLLNGLSTLVKFTKESWVTGLVAIVKDRLGWLLGWLLPTENLVTNLV